MASIEETIQLARLQQAAHSSSLYERKHNQKALKVLTVAAYMLFVSMAAIILSFYYVFIWDPTTKPLPPRANTNCDTTNKIVIPENIAIQLANSSEVSIELFFPDIYRRYQQYQQEQSVAQQSSVRQKGRSGKGAKYNRRLNKPPKPRDKNPELSRVSTTEINQPMSPTSNEQLPYVDDEDTENDYDQSEASGTN